MNMEMVQWQTKQLRDVLTIGNGRDYKHLQNGDVPVYGTGGVMTYVNEYLYDGETVCIGRKGTIDKPIYHIGKIWTVDTLFFTHSFIGVIPLFLYYEFCNVNWNKYNEATGVPSLSKETIYKIGIPIPVESDGTPSLPAQRRIVEILSSVDKVIDSTEALIKKYKAIKMGLLDELLQPKDNWKMARLGDVVVDSFAGGTPNRSREDFFGGDIPWVTSSEVNNPTIDHTLETITLLGLNNSSAKWIPDNSILVALYGATAGQVSMLKIKATSNQAVLAIIPNNEIIDTDFLYYQIIYNKHSLLFLAQGSGQPNLSKNIVDDMNFPMPTSLAEQQHISSILRSVDKKIFTEQKTLEKYRNLKKGLMKDLFKGK